MSCRTPVAQRPSLSTKYGHYTARHLCLALISTAITASAATTHTVYCPGTSHLGLQPSSTKWQHVYTCGRCNALYVLLQLHVPGEYAKLTCQLSAPQGPQRSLFQCERESQGCTVYTVLLPSNVIPSQCLPDTNCLTDTVN
jgi:hypothetical protein